MTITTPTTPAAADLTTLIPLVEAEPGHYIDLRTVAEFEDERQYQRLYLVMKDHTETGEPRVIAVYGEARRFCFAWAAAMARAALFSLEGLAEAHPAPQRTTGKKAAA